MMSFEILPNKTSIIESVSMRSRHVLSVKIMMIFFQKLSWTNQVLSYVRQEIFFRVYFIKLVEIKILL